ncbi:MAG: MFS transporter [Microthrixaceae bacterium]
MRRTPLWFSFALTLVGITSNALVTPALPNVLAEFSASKSTSGLIVASGSVAGIFMAPVVGVAADRIGRRPIIVGCLLLFGSFGGMVALAPTLPLFLAARFLQGVGSAGLINLAVVLIGDSTTGARRTKLIGRNSAVLTTGLALLPLLSGAVTELFDWRVTFGLYALALPLAAVGWRVVAPAVSVREDTVGSQLRGVAQAVRHPVNLASIAGATLVFIAIFGLFLTVLPLHLEGRFGLNAAQRGAVLSVPAITSTLVAFNLGRFRSVLSARRLLSVAGGLFVVAFPTMGAAGVLWLVLVAALLYGAGEGFFVPTLQEVTVTNTPDEHRAAALAAWTSASRFGQTTGPLIAGGLLKVTGTSTVLGLGGLLGVAIVGLAHFGPIGRVGNPEVATSAPAQG